MPKQFSSQEVIDILSKKGFVFVSQRGSHIKYRKGEFTVIIPWGRKEIPLGTLRSIIRQAGLNKHIFQR